jgi:tetratricopeptide (TPR) repeat protein
MKIIIVLLLVFLVALPAISQQPKKQEMQSQMKEAINEINKQVTELDKQIAEAIKNKEEAESISDLQRQRNMLVKQLQMMGGVSKSLGNLTEKQVDAALQEELIVPKRDTGRLSLFPRKLMSESELMIYLRRVHGQVEIIIPPKEKTDALEIYNDTKAKTHSTDAIGNAASSCWMLGHSEKAVFIIGKVCLDSIRNTDNLNNYAAFLTMLGAEHAALPILQYLNYLYPKNSSIYNNLGQAWFGLGELEAANKYLDSAILLDPTHSTANETLSQIHLSRGQTQQTIASLKASLKEVYDPEKHAQLTNLGYQITYSDLPAFNYPMMNDPFGLIPLVNSLPDHLQTDVDDIGPALTLRRFLNGVSEFKEELVEENRILGQDLYNRGERISMDSGYGQAFLKPHNSPGYKTGKAHADLQDLAVQLGLRRKPPTASEELEYLTPEEIVFKCHNYWRDSVLAPIDSLSKYLRQQIKDKNCSAANQTLNAYLKKRDEIFNKGVQAIKTLFIDASPKLTNWIKTHLYATMDPPPSSTDNITMNNLFISKQLHTQARDVFKNASYEFALKIFDEAFRLDIEYRNLCKPTPPPVPNPGAENVRRHKKDDIGCEFEKWVEPSGEYKFVLFCNTLTEKIDPKLSKKNPPNPKGKAKSAKKPAQRSTRPPMRGPGGSLLFTEENKDETITRYLPPLIEEDKDLSQFSIAYDRWGNLTGFDVQLNKEGNALADPDSKFSDIYSRWTWIAAGSTQKGILNKLSIK